MKIKKLLSGFILIVVMSAFVTASSVPILPMIIHGNAKINNEDIYVGAKITAMIGNKEIGVTTITEQGKYTIVVNGNREDEGETVEFYIDDVKTKQTAIWKSSDVKNLDLSTKASLNSYGKITGAYISPLPKIKPALTTAIIITIISMIILFIFLKKRNGGTSK